MEAAKEEEHICSATEGVSWLGCCGPPATHNRTGHALSCRRCRLLKIRVSQNLYREEGERTSVPEQEAKDGDDGKVHDSCAHAVGPVQSAKQTHPCDDI